MNQILSMVVALSAITGVTVYEGIRFGFWDKTDPEELNHFVERLTTVPTKVGDWSSEEAEVDKGQLGAAEVRGYVSRNYVNAKTGAKVNVFLVCGKTHPMAIHSPDACYAAVGFKQGETSRRYISSGGRTAEVWRAPFTREVSLRYEGLDIIWSWSGDDGIWQAPTNPRPHFSNKNALYKLYVITQPGAEAAGEAFLHDFLPVLDKQLFTPVEPASDGVAEQA